MDYIKTVEEAGDKLIEGIRAAQDYTVAAVEPVGKAVGGFVPNVGPLPVDMPKPREVVESAFRFWQRLAENQKEFTLKLIDAIEPVVVTARKKA